MLDYTDCDDENDGIYPEADELCDGVDENCDEIIDNDAINEFNWYFDGDGDGYGTESQIIIGCEQPNNFTLELGIAMIKTMIFTHLLRNYVMEKMRIVMKPLMKMPSIETTGTSTWMKMALETKISLF